MRFVNHTQPVLARAVFLQRSEVSKASNTVFAISGTTKSFSLQRVSSEGSQELRNLPRARPLRQNGRKRSQTIAGLKETQGPEFSSTNKKKKQKKKTNSRTARRTNETKNDHGSINNCHLSTVIACYPSSYPCEGQQQAGICSLEFWVLCRL